MLTDRTVTLLAASAAGVLLADPRGELRVAAASSEEAGLVELFQLQNDQGPCLDCFRTGRPVTAADLSGPGQQWPVRRSCRTVRIPDGRGAADAAAGSGHRRAEPFRR